MELIYHKPKSRVNFYFKIFTVCENTFDTALKMHTDHWASKIISPKIVNLEYDSIISVDSDDHNTDCQITSNFVKVRNDAVYTKNKYNKNNHGRRLLITSIKKSAPKISFDEDQEKLYSKKRTSLLQGSHRGNELSCWRGSHCHLKWRWISPRHGIHLYKSIWIRKYLPIIFLW